VTRRLARRDERVRLVRLRVNVGLTGALLAGFAVARGGIVVTMDSDLQYDPSDIPGLVAHLDQFDAALGYRSRRRDPWMKRVSSRIANSVRTLVLQDAVRDSACTMRAMHRECLAAIAHGMHRFVPTLLKQAGFRVIEVAVHHRPRAHGVSKYGVRNRTCEPSSICSPCAGCARAEWSATSWRTPPAPSDHGRRGVGESCRQKTASGLAGEPVPPLTGIGEITSMNSSRDSS
jgi:hypothetical protein